MQEHIRRAVGVDMQIVFDTCSLLLVARRALHTQTTGAIAHG